MKVKVCGLTQTEQLLALNLPELSHLGLIFHPASPRFAGEIKLPDLPLLPKLTGVFVHASTEKIISTARAMNLNSIQLHGGQDPDTCMDIKIAGFEIIKVIHLEDADFSILDDFTHSVDYFLFDSGKKSSGGNGRPFDWKLLDDYSGAVPFFLSGGIGIADVARIRSLAHPQLAGVDINSKFELQPGVKDIALLKKFLKQLLQ